MTNGDVVGGGSSPASNVAPKGKRFSSDIIDLILIPVLLGLVAGFVLIAVPEGLRNMMLILINVGWLIVRDLVFSPGRKLVGLKLTSLTGPSVSFLYAVIRNIPLMIPFVLTTGYPCEFIRVYIPKILWRRIAYSLVLLFALFVGGSAVVSEMPLYIKGLAILAIVLPPLFLFLDKEGLSEGDRLFDVYAKTRVAAA